MNDGLQLKINGKFATEKVFKSIRFGGANALTQTAVQAKEAVQGAIRGRFTLRGRWFERGKYAIKTQPATPGNLAAKVYTLADWLQKQIEGGTIRGSSNVRVLPYKYKGVEYLAIPTSFLRPHGSTKVLRPNLWPQNLQNAFVIKTKKTGALLLMQRVAKGRNKGVKPMYLLIPTAKINAADTFYEPIQKVCERRLALNLQTYINKALADIK